MRFRAAAACALAAGALSYPLAVTAQNPAVTVTVNAAANRHPISPLIYGIASGSPTVLSDLGAPLNRYGGNNASRYNWQLNADNRGNDWYYESIADTSAVAGERGDSFISGSKSGGAAPMVTIPMIGWVAKVGANRGKLASFSQAKYGAQTGADWSWFPDAGNGILKATGKYVTGNDPNDANVVSDSTYQQGWVRHILNTFGSAAAGGLKYYILDNEPSIWHGTHRDVHPVGATMDEVRDKMIDYAAHIKAVDPSAKVVGPEEWGWSGYFFSGYDQQYGGAHGWSYLPDRAAHNNADYVAYLLSQIRQHDATTGQRSLDVFSLHFYPQGGEYGNDVSTNTQLLRNRSTRALWDPSYVDQSWIGAPVELIPRMKSWVNTYYPGTQIAITEYNWGAEGYINGATAQADIYGIFGREGLDMAARWTYPSASTPTYKAMKMYGNYDGSHHGFGDTSVSDSVPNPDNLSSFAAVRSSDGAMTVMVINKVLSGSTPVTVSLANFLPGGSAQAWQLTSANAITRLADVPVAGSSLTATVPAQSITLFVIPAGSAPAPPPNQAPVAKAAATPTSGYAPLAVSFSSAGSSDPDGSIASYSWSFGDGTSATGATASHTYASTGTFTATLTVTDNQGATGSASVTVTATTKPNQAPTAKITATPTSGTAPLAVSFSSTGSSDPDGTIASYAWSFGDGTTATGATASHTYSAAGTYTATLTVTDNQGAKGTATATIAVAAPPAGLPAPTGLKASVSGSTVLLTWTRATDQTEYILIERAPAGTASFQTIGATYGYLGGYQNTVAAGSYLYRVRYYKSGVYSPYAGPVSATVP